MKQASFPSDSFRKYVAERGNIVTIGTFYVIEG